MTYLYKRSDSGHWQFRMRVPKQHLDSAVGKLAIFDFPAFRGAKAHSFTYLINGTIKFSVKTDDRLVAESRDSLARAYLQKVFDSSGKGPTSLTNKDLVALAGAVYRLFKDKFEADPGSPEKWAALKGYNRAVREGRISDAPPLLPGQSDDEAAALARFGEGLTDGINALPPSTIKVDLEHRFGLLTNWVLLSEGLNVDEATRTKLMIKVANASTLVAETLKRTAADDDYSDDLVLKRFPTFTGTTHYTLDDLFERWQKDSKPSFSTVTTWKGVIKSLKAHLGHDSASRVTSENIVAWKDMLIDRGLTAKTVSHTYLACVKCLYNHARDNKRLKTNPAEEIKMTVKRKAGTKRLPYTDEEVCRLVDLAAGQRLPIRRWLPLLAATTGARIGELAQLWAERVKSVNGVIVLDIQPAEDFGSLKNEGSERPVPLHPLMIDLGFLEFVKKRGEGPLFYQKLCRDPEKKHPYKGVTNHLAKWIRTQGFNDTRKDPNHALRHWWKTAASRVGIQDSMADGIQGHSPDSVASVYRHFDLRTLAKAVASIPIPRAEAPPDRLEGDRPS
ncbi:tyrosine-type recombinase/integrase [Microvirga brassicacearum]|nr:tyrosine-type recombinase/integrase [Microvirga brassicacearum]